MPPLKNAFAAPSQNREHVDKQESDAIHPK